VIAGLVPVKALSRAKSRLAPSVGRATAAQLQLAMLADVVAALRGVPALARVAVVTPDVEVAKAAEACGAEVFLRADPGLNPAVEGAAAELAADGVLVVLGDVCCARSDELAQLVAALEAPGVVLAPSRDGGTSALLRMPRDVIAAGFGPDSARVHRERARRAGVHLRELALPSLAIDVDDADSLAAVRASGAAGPHTRALLALIEARSRP
jgi:2-phospho-L-lactate guanylyltransferase